MLRLISCLDDHLQHDEHLDHEKGSGDLDDCRKREDDERIMIMMMIIRMVTAIEFLECPFKVKSVERSQNSAFTLCKVRFFTIPCPKHFHISFDKTDSITVKLSVLPKYATFEMSKLKANTHCTTIKE